MLYLHLVYAAIEATKELPQMLATQACFYVQVQVTLYFEGKTSKDFILIFYFDRAGYQRNLPNQNMPFSPRFCLLKRLY